MYRRLGSIGLGSGMPSCRMNCFRVELYEIRVIVFLSAFGVSGSVRLQCCRLRSPESVSII